MVDATLDGKLEIFPKGELEEMLAKSLYMSKTERDLDLTLG